MDFYQNITCDKFQSCIALSLKYIVNMNNLDFTSKLSILNTMYFGIDKIRDKSKKLFSSNFFVGM